VSSAADGRAFYDSMARQYLERLQKKDVAYFGEKTPEHTGHLPRILQLFPDAKILVLYRDGRDVAVSLSKMPWMCSDLYVNYLVWLYYFSVVRKVKDAAHPNFYFARYENVVAAPEKELGGILQFLGLDYEPSVAQGWGNREGIPEREYPWKEQALYRINGDRVGIFRRELTTEQIERLERLGRHALEALGYELVTDGRKRLSPGFLLGLSYRFARFASRLPLHSVAWELFIRSFLSRPFPVPAPAPAPPGDRVAVKDRFVAI
jgi:Sulfotransferase family